MMLTFSDDGIRGIGGWYFQKVVSYGIWFVVQNLLYRFSMLFFVPLLRCLVIYSLTLMGLNMSVSLANLRSLALVFTCSLRF